MKSGELRVITGPMYSGKTSALVRAVRRCIIARKKIKVFKHSVDSRYQGKYAISTHDGVSIDVVPVSLSVTIGAKVTPEDEVVFIEEAQFFDSYLPIVVTNLVDRGKSVTVVGTDTDFRGHSFGPMGELLAIADEVVKLKAICITCGAEATRNQRLINGEPAHINDPVVLVGAKESYEARCRSCHTIRR